MRQHPSRRRWWRLVAAAPLPLLVPLWALWRDVFALDASGVERVGGGGALASWALLSLVSLALVASLFSGVRTLRVAGYTFHSLLLAVAFGVAAVLGVAHAFGGPTGGLAAPAWALAGLALTALLCAAAILATAALFVLDVREVGESSGE